MSGKESACRCGKGGIVAVAAAAGTVEDEPGELVFFAHRLFGNEGHARIGEAAEDFDARTDGGKTAFGADVQVGIVQRTNERNRPLSDVEVLTVGFVAAFDDFHRTDALDGFTRSGSDVQPAAYGDVCAVTDETDIVVEVEREVKVDRCHGGGLFLLFTQDDDIVVQRGHGGFLRTEHTVVAV